MKTIQIIQKKSHNGRYTFKFPDLASYLLVTTKINKLYRVISSTSAMPLLMFHYLSEELLEATSPAFVNPMEYINILNTEFDQYFGIDIHIQNVGEIKCNVIHR